MMPIEEVILMNQEMQAELVVRGATIKRLENLLRLADRAIGDHNAPGDCYATGPMTGDPIADLIECPACTYIAVRKG